jgi:hypothetical protein
MTRPINIKNMPASEPVDRRRNMKLISDSELEKALDWLRDNAQADKRLSIKGSVFSSNSYPAAP